MLATTLFLCLPVPALAVSSYSIRDSYMGFQFLDTWRWETEDDPTHGRTNYLDKNTSISLNLTVASNTSFIMRADNVNMVPPAERGESKEPANILPLRPYGDSLIMLDLWHMPTGCATWPAFWTVSKAGPWPHGGEVDIIEGVNNNANNLASLHTTANCNMTQIREQSGQTISTQCDASYNYNQGCGVSFTKRNSYGRPFNLNGGGYYVMRRGECGIFVWFWSRRDPSVPPEVSQGLNTVNPDPSFWGEPDAVFPTDSCDYPSHFDAHSIVFDLTFCGDWAGSPSAYNSDTGCPGNCIDFVNNNPRAFDEAYWEIGSLRVYAPNDDTSK
ncbi:putative glycosidase C21B10.07 [Mycena venus]|uniref:Putative glycosidase C21B10.07 n=1 Tax=Mycena venus TaxID=2733690 RepID=A0A8H7D7S7_9AGAR|nr:putative glycosidase C21B10.07 [Mycena venus]